QHDPDAQDNEMPQHEVILPSFSIGQHPLTVAEYQCAVEADAVTPPKYPLMTWQSQLQRLDHPVVCLTWHQAKDYAAWLAQVTGQPWRLPTEAEWEKTARGSDGRIFPWGDQWDKSRANTADGGAGMTTPVGSYPGGVSPYEVHDLTGNVREWTST